MRDQPNILLRRLSPCSLIPQRAYTDIDSGTVAMEVGISQGVCNNSPAESVYLDNGCRLSKGFEVDTVSQIQLLTKP